MNNTPNNNEEEIESIQVYIDEDLKELIPGYLERMRSNVEEFDRLLNGKEYKNIKNIAHNMKGSGGGYGFDLLTDLGARIEQAAKVQDPELIRQYVDELSIYLDKLKVVYYNQHIGP